jgi:flagellar biosynthetic protein FlhB
MAENKDSAQERTEEPTERRLEKAREEGQFPQSRDLTTLFLLSGFVLLLMSAGPLLIERMVRMMGHALRFSDVDRFQDFLLEFGADSVLSVMLVLVIFVAAGWILSMLAPLILIAFKPRFALRFDLSKLDPIAGIGRIFSLRSLAELIKTVLKASLVLGVGVGYLVAVVGSVRMLVAVGFEDAIAAVKHLLMVGALLLLAPLVLIGGGDAWFQWFNFRRQMRMSLQEIKEEMKESEGSPEVRAQQRQRQRAMASSRMVAAVERADVVVMNPEHFAVALRYDPERMQAPVVLAKGQDAVALRMRDAAIEHGVPVAPLPPLARWMYARLDVGANVPAALFEAVARVLAWAYNAKEGTRDVLDLPEIGTLPE